MCGAAAGAATLLCASVDAAAGAIVSAAPRQDGALSDNAEAVAFEADDPMVGVREQDHVPNAEIEQDLRADAIVAQLRLRRGPTVEPAHPFRQARRERLAKQHDDPPALPADQ